MSKLREEAARFITEAGFEVHPLDIDPVSGYWKRVDCYRFEIFTRGRHLGCWLSLTEFVRECKKYGGAELCPDGPVIEINPKYPKSES